MFVIDRYKPHKIRSFRNMVCQCQLIRLNLLQSDTPVEKDFGIGWQWYRRAAHVHLSTSIYFVNYPFLYLLLFICINFHLCEIEYAKDRQEKNERTNEQINRTANAKGARAHTQHLL